MAWKDWRRLVFGTAATAALTVGAAHEVNKAIDHAHAARVEQDFSAPYRDRASKVEDTCDSAADAVLAGVKIKLLTVYVRHAAFEANQLRELVAHQNYRFAVDVGPAREAILDLLQALQTRSVADQGALEAEINQLKAADAALQNLQ